MVRIKTKKEIEKMRDSCKLASDVLEMISEHIQEGVTTHELDRICHDYIVDHGAYPSSLNYHGFPKSVCISPNDTVCHGIPSKKTRLNDGDILNIDVTVHYNGYHGDTSRMYAVGRISDRARRLIEVTEEAMYRGIAVVGPNKRLGDVGHAIQSFTEGQGYSVVRDYIGHGVGREFHEDPPVHHVGTPGTGLRLKPGMTFTIEPMINEGSHELKILNDNWTVLTQDGGLSAQFEHTILVTEHGHEILTLHRRQNQGRLFMTNADYPK
jgi:methionyl aminopeptidase